MCSLRVHKPRANALSSGRVHHRHAASPTLRAERPGAVGSPPRAVAHRHDGRWRGRSSQAKCELRLRVSESRGRAGAVRSNGRGGPRVPAHVAIARKGPAPPEEHNAGGNVRVLGPDEEIGQGGGVPEHGPQAAANRVPCRETARGEARGD